MRRAPILIALVLAAPVLAGLLGVVLPAFGYLPALGGTGFSLQPIHDLLAMPGLGRSLALSLSAGLAATLLSTLAAMLFVASTFGTRVFRSVQRGLGPLLAVPHAAAAFGLAVLIAPSGPLFRLAAGPLGLDRPPDLLILGDPLGLAMIAGLVLKETPFLLLVIAASLSQADAAPRLRLARSLGYGRFAGFLLAVWPAVYRQIRLPVLAVAAFSSSVVDVALILGPSRPAPLAVRLAGWMADPDLALRFAASAGALLQLASTLLVVGAWLVLERAGARLRTALAGAGLRWRRDGVLRGLAAAPVVLGGLVSLVSLGALALWSFAGLWAFPDLVPPSLGLRTWRTVLGGAGRPLVNAAAIASLSALAALAFAIALLEAVRRAGRGAGRAGLPPLAAGLLALPLLVPQVAFVFGLQVLALLSDLRPSLLLVAAAHTVFVAPYVTLALADPWFALDPRYEGTARSLGRSGLAVFVRLRLALLAGPILAAGAIGVAVSVGQYLPTLLIGAGRVPTITTEAVALASGGDRRVVGATALLQAAIPFLAFAAAAALPRLLHRGRRGMRSS